MRKISASYVFTLTGAPLKNGIVVFDASGTIVEVIDTRGKATEIQGLEHYAGVLAPGFINAQTNLDWAFAREALPQGLCQLSYSLQQEMLASFACTSELRLRAARQADRLLFKTGCSVVADVSQNPLFTQLKQNSPIEYIDAFAPENFKVLCPRSQVYQNASFNFENSLNDFPDRLLIGTHSLAANTSLQLLDELIFLQQHFNVNLEYLLPLVCSNAARAFLVNGRFGTLEPGKQPGVNLITGVDFKTFKLLPHARAQRLV